MVKVRIQQGEVAKGGKATRPGQAQTRRVRVRLNAAVKKVERDCASCAHLGLGSSSMRSGKRRMHSKYWMTYSSS
jgi:hypothetical protein